MWVTLALVGLQIGLFAYSYYTREDEEDDDRPGDSKRRGSTTVAEDGAAVPLVYGTCRVRRTNILMYQGRGSFAEYMRTSFTQLSDPDRKEYNFKGLLGICASPIANSDIEFLRVWAGDSKLIDTVQPITDDFFVNDIQLMDLWGGTGKGGGIRGTLLPQNGALTQTESELIHYHFMNTNQSPGNDPATYPHYGGMSGLCSMWVFLGVGERSAMPGISVEMSILPDYTGTVLSTVAGAGNELEANPAACLYQLLTESWVGLDIDVSKINDASFNAVAVTLSTEGNGFSMVFDKATKAKNVIRQIIKQIDGVLYLDPEDQLLYLDLIREDYSVPGLALFDDSNVVKVASYKETAWEDTYNEVRLQYEDRTTEYNEKYAVAQDSANASAAGRLKTIDLNFPGVKVASTANKLAARELKFYATPQTLVTLHINRQGTNIRPGSVIKWTCETYSITEMVLRIHKIALSEADDGVIVIHCTRDKYSDVSTVFRDPDRHWLEDIYTTPTLPDCYDVLEPPPNPIGDEGSNWETPLFGQGVIIAASPLPSSSTSTFGNQALSQISVAEGNDVASAGGDRSSVPCGSLGVSYSTSPGTYWYYDTTFAGLVVAFDNTDGAMLRNSTEDEVRAGRAILSIGDEFLSYESFTDTDAPVYRSSSQTETATSQTDITITLPAGVIDGDLLVAMINLGTSGLDTAPAGWVHVTGSPLVNTGGGVDNNFVVMTKAASSEPADYTWTRLAADTMEIQGSVHAFTNGAILDFAQMNANFGTPASGINTGVYSGVGDSPEIILTGIAISESWWSGTSLVLPSDGMTEIDDSSTAIDGHLQVQYGPSSASVGVTPAREEGNLVVDLNLAGVPPASAYSTVIIGLKGPSSRSYKLNNVWRGLFDTVPIDHVVGEPVFFLSESDMGKITTEKRFACQGEEVVLQLQPAPSGERVSEDPDRLYAGIAFTQRGQRPVRPNGFVLINNGADAAALVPEMDYAYNEEEPLEVVNTSTTGLDTKVSSAGVYGDVWTNDLRGTWNRRPKITDCGAAVVRGDDVDAPYGKGESISLCVESKGDQEASWSRVAQEDIQGNPIRGNGDFITMAQVKNGPGSIRLCAFGDSPLTGEELMSREAEDLTVDVHSARQLLLNRDFTPFWDVFGDSSVSYGDGKSFPGNPVFSARGWVNATSGGGRPRYKSMPTPLTQGNLGEGFAFTGEFVDSEYINIEQVVAVPYLDTEGSEIDLSWYFMTARVGDEFTVTINTLDVDGEVLDTATVNTSPGTDADEWARYSLRLTSMSAAVKSIKVNLGIQTPLTSIGPALTKVSMVMGREIATDQLLDSDFDSLTNWTQQVGVWTLETSVGPLVPVDLNSTNFVLSPVADGELVQVVSLPAAYGAGDYVRIQWWSANTDVLDYGGMTMLARDGAAGTLATVTVGGDPNENVEQWYFHEAYLKLPGEVADIHVKFFTKAVSGAIDYAFDDVDLTFIKGSS